jgi:hypothetical protein
MTENAGEPVGHRFDDASGLLCLVASEAAVDACHNEVEGGENIVRIVQRPIREDIRLYTLEEAKVAAELLVQRVDFVVLPGDVVYGQTSRIVRRPRMIRHSR